MIRFLPDTLLDLILRPWYMILPRSGVYVEFTAPDFRVLAFCLIVPFALYGLRRRWHIRSNRSLVASAVVFLLAFVVWCVTSGNGRYFMPFMAIVGPLLVALVSRLPMSRAMKVFALLLIIAVQVGLVSVNPPWNPANTLELSTWSDTPPFVVSGGALDNNQDVTYVTVTEQSYSVIAPMFGDKANWINLRYFEGYDFFGSSSLLADARRRLSEAKVLRLLVRSFPRSSEPDSGLPNEETLAFFESYLRPYGLALLPKSSCKLLPSNTVADAELASFSPKDDHVAQEIRRYAGFWVCPLVFSGRSSEDEANQLRASLGGRLIEKMEKICPKYFPAGQVMFRREGDDLVRSYPSSDVRLIYSEHDKRLFAKFTFALNPVLLGDAEVVGAESFSYDCRRFVRWESF